MPFNTRRLLGALLLATAPLRSLAAQEEAPRPSMACVRGAPLPACGGFVLVEAQGTFPLTQTRRRVPFGPPIETFESRLEWNLGYMVNVSEKWALGGALSVGTGTNDPLTGLRARARRWIGPELSLELGAGIVKSQGLFYYGDVTGATAEARLNVNDLGALFVRWDGIDVPGFNDPYGSFSDPGGYQQAVSVGVGAGSTWAMKGTLAAGAVFGLWMLFFLSTWD